jgi:hypothetical protein
MKPLLLPIRPFDLDTDEKAYNKTLYSLCYLLSIYLARFIEGK